MDRARRLAWCREVRRSDRVAEDKASGRDTRADLEGSSSNSPADRPGRSPRRAGSRCGGKVTILSAPAGSGKTSLLRAWANRPGQAHGLAVLQVQRDQHDAQQFWLSLLDAVRHASGTTSRAEPPTATPDFNGPAMVDRVLSELADARDGITLVIDDLHELHSPEALAQLTRLLTNLPANVHAILATRRDLRLELHRPARRRAGRARGAELRFTERETRELLEASGIALSDAGWRCCTRGPKGGLRACGWRRSRWLVTPIPSGSWPSSPAATARSPNTCSPRCWTASRRDPAAAAGYFLLDRVNGELADLLTGRPGSERILLELEDANAWCRRP